MEISIRALSIACISVVLISGTIRVLTQPGENQSDHSVGNLTSRLKPIPNADFTVLDSFWDFNQRSARPSGQNSSLHASRAQNSGAKIMQADDGRQTTDVPADADSDMDTSPSDQDSDGSDDSSSINDDLPYTISGNFPDR